MIRQFSLAVVSLFLCFPVLADYNTSEENKEWVAADDGKLTLAEGALILIKRAGDYRFSLHGIDSEGREIEKVNGPMSWTFDHEFVVPAGKTTFSGDCKYSGVFEYNARMDVSNIVLEPGETYTLRCQPVPKKPGLAVITVWQKDKGYVLPEK
ncbi:hypothetical protein LRP49_11835 [Enterovibrio sp. ZSDZ35]|uniref:Uncharacterized protein n=1 Tax=Enterovibrio qingdaonensis TaxID=2899818 RepID=A0ABT5QLK7_9GAMM|nr:hypothetical protein [Enterovibrio sp. ZSDZ35]MDD1781865.1 hypothetical protein [Enterovibrio sp. ZSDZ35]